MGLFGRKKQPTFGAGSSVFRSARRRERKHLRRRWQWIALGLVLVVAGIAGYGVYYYFSLQGDIQVEVPGTEPQVEGRPFNVLLVGSDSRAGLTKAEQLDLGAGTEGVTGERADTLILAHIDPGTDHITMVQFPRDLWVPVNGRKEAKINSSLEFGRAAVVATVRELTGLPIHHYVQVNIAGFRNLIDAIDGVDVCVPEPVPFDPNTGIEIKPDEVGMVHFDGDRALRFVRSRKVFGEGDLSRIQNQQRFLAAAIDKVTSVATFFRPGRITALADVARENLVVDQDTTINGLKDIGLKLRSFNPDDYEAYTAPNFGARNITVGGTEVSIVEPNLPAIEVLFDAIARNESPAEADGVPDIDPTTIRVGVYNGVGLDRPVAGPAAEELERATDTGNGGVVISRDNIANAPNFKFRGVTVRYNQDEPEAAVQAELVAAALPGATIEAGRTERSVDVAVIVGRGRFRTTQLVQLLPIPIPRPGALPEVCR